ncbi:MAG: TlpA disulfide reductase family protein [Chitinophagales bacterium]|nr:TlpA disulfide reductase family protein [Chitinophagales bacterium]
MKLHSILFFFLLAAMFVGCNSNGGKLINGQKAPQLSLTTVDGQQINLDQFKGKIVLIDFWASWCKPCRKANPALVKLYGEFHDKPFQGANGFEIISISLDTKEQAWKNAIEKDSLYWPWHTSELRGWKAKAAEAYDVHQIPTSFLIDQNGMIIGKDLSPYDIGKILHQRLYRQ